MLWRNRKIDSMVLVNILILLAASVLGGTLNGVAGGGSFITFPALIYVGVPPVQANATSTAGLWPASASAAWALRRELVRQNKTLLLVLGLSSLVGGVGGALLLLKTPQATFTLLIPFLMLLATLLFAVSPLVNARLKQRAIARQKERGVERDEPRLSWFVLLGTALLQLIISIYGGYFGGGIGILMLASLGLMGMQDINEMNAVKNALAACINGVAIITFAVLGAIVWQYVLVMIVGTLASVPTIITSTYCPTIAPSTAKVMMATPLIQAARAFLTAFISLMSCMPIRPSEASIRMPMPPPK